MKRSNSRHTGRISLERRDVHVRAEDLASDLRGASLVGGVGVGVQEADGDGLDALVPEPLGGDAHLVLVERRDDLARRR